ncbi:efflux RND transporter periplasmic adaptor subunit [Ruminococcus gauvreauii]|uniref:Efflux RND transporter periplasmic adaptor subunit n=1 Tax=Ruminococcus gauvreauii TaxID=438033 RepID=A0ABY5VIZ5_9FIRM|nr:efflux RND transporter periplasmic adaptor subunit [Ruminococcus gauvreauii]UWP60565.1 efflux RND transporter periplasmic adaptor subunit [Ruminococcus gauvreauii]
MVKKKKINKIMIGVIAAVVVIIAVLALASKNVKAPEATAQVNVINVEKGDVSEELDATGTVKSLQKKTFYSPVNATVQDMPFEVGDSVKEGEQLITYDLEDLEKENQKAELNVKSGKLDYNDAVNQANKAADKQATAAANAQSLQAQVDDWQQYVYDLQDAIAAETENAKNEAIQEAQDATAEAQELYAQQKAEYDKEKAEYDKKLEKLSKVKADALKRSQLPSATEEQKAKALEDYSLAVDDYNRLAAQPPTEPAYSTGAGGAVSGEEIASTDTTELQRELERASATLAELQGELASEKAAAEADVSTLTAETKEKMQVATNLSELEAKSVEELIAEGKKGVQAEFTGVISDSKVAGGAAVSQGMEMFTLESTKNVCVEIQVSKYDFAMLKEGQKATITLGDNTYQGTLTKINKVAIPNEKGTPMIGATVKIDNPDENIFIGVEAKVTVQAASADNVLVVPVEAVNIGNDGSFCYVLRDGVIAKQTIETGISSDEYMEVKSGLKEGDQVIPDLGTLQEGDQAQAASGAAGGADGVPEGAVLEDDV